MYKEKFYTEELENMLEELVFEQLYEIVKNNEKEFCKCNICIQDIAAIVLNKMPPRYKNSVVDKVYINENERKVTDKLRMEIRKNLFEAIEKTAHFPHH